MLSLKLLILLVFCVSTSYAASQSSSSEIKRAYHALALRYHPDKNKTKGAEEMFRNVATAFEVLSDEKTKAKYDDMLDNPDALRHYYNYARFRTGTHHTATWKVMVGLLLLMELGHYLYWWSRFKLMRKWIARDPRVQARLKAKGVEDDQSAEDSLDEVVSIQGWQGRPPTWRDVLVWKIFLFPLRLHDAVYFQLRWLILFTLLKKPYGPRERDYLTRTILRASETVWQSVPAAKRKELVDKELWIPARFAEYRKECISRMKAKKKYGRG